MKVTPFEKLEPGKWGGKFGRYAVEITKRKAGQFWRGPGETAEARLILDLDLISYGIHFSDGRGSGWSSCAYTLAGAMAVAEQEAFKYIGGLDVPRPRYGLTVEQQKAEAEAMAVHRRAAIEADRLAVERYGEESGTLAIEALPELLNFGLREGLITGALMSRRLHRKRGDYLITYRLACRQGPLKDGRFPAYVARLGLGNVPVSMETALAKWQAANPDAEAVAIYNPDHLDPE